MSYDLMVFETSAAPKAREDFMKWYEEQTEWSEDHSYQDPVVTSEPLQVWFKEMVEFFPAMNGPFASDDIDSPTITDYSIGKDVIYSAFSWPVAEEAHDKVKELAIKHSVGFFDVSADEGEIIFPNQPDAVSNSKPWWKFW